MADRFISLNNGKKINISKFLGELREKDISAENKALFNIFDFNNDKIINSEESYFIGNLILNYIATFDRNEKNISDKDLDVFKQLFSDLNKFENQEITNFFTELYDKIQLSNTSHFTSNYLQDYAKNNTQNIKAIIEGNLFNKAGAFFNELFSGNFELYENLEEQISIADKKSKDLINANINGLEDFKKIYKEYTKKDFSVEEAENFESKSTKFVQVRELHYKKEALKRGLTQVRNKYEYEEYLKKEKNPYAQAAGALKSSWHEDFGNVILQFFGNNEQLKAIMMDAIAPNFSPNASKEKIFAMFDNLAKMAEDLYTENLGDSTYENIEKEYKEAFQKIYGEKEISDEVYENVSSALQIGGLVEISVLIAIQIILTKLAGPAAKPAINSLVAKFGEKAVREGIRLLSASGTVALDYGLKLLSEAISKNGITEEELESINSGIKHSAAFIFFATYLSGPISNKITESIKTQGVVSKAFESGISKTTDGITTRSMSGQEFIMALNKNAVSTANKAQNVLAHSVGFASEIGSFALLDMVMQDASAKDALEGSAKMLTELKVISYILNIILGKTINWVSDTLTNKSTKTTEISTLKNNFLDKMQINETVSPMGQTTYTITVNGQTILSTDNPNKLTISLINHISSQLSIAEKIKIAQKYDNTIIKVQAAREQFGFSFDEALTPEKIKTAFKKLVKIGHEANGGNADMGTLVEARDLLLTYSNLKVPQNTKFTTQTEIVNNPTDITSTEVNPNLPVLLGENTKRAFTQLMRDALVAQGLNVDGLQGINKNIPEGTTSSKKELFQRAHTENPAKIVAGKVKKQLLKDGLDTKTPNSSTVDLWNLDPHAGLKEHNQEINNEVLSLFLTNRLTEVLTQYYTELENSFKDIAARRSDDIRNLAITCGNDKRKFANSLVQMLCEDFGIKGLAPEVKFYNADRGLASGQANFYTGCIEISSHIDDAKTLVDILSHELTHMVQFFDLFVQYGTEGIRELVINDKSTPESSKETVINQILNNPFTKRILLIRDILTKNKEAATEALQKMGISTERFSQYEIGSLKEFINRIYKEEATYGVRANEEDYEGYFNSVREREAYHLASQQIGNGIKSVDDITYMDPLLALIMQYQDKSNIPNYIENVDTTNAELLENSPEAKNREEFDIRMQHKPFAIDETGVEIPKIENDLKKLKNILPEEDIESIQTAIDVCEFKEPEFKEMVSNLINLKVKLAQNYMYYKNVDISGFIFNLLNTEDVDISKEKMFSLISKLIENGVPFDKINSFVGFSLDAKNMFGETFISYIDKGENIHETLPLIFSKDVTTKIGSNPYVLPEFVCLLNMFNNINDKSIVDFLLDNENFAVALSCWDIDYSNKDLITKIINIYNKNIGKINETPEIINILDQYKTSEYIQDIDKETAQKLENFIKEQIIPEEMVVYRGEDSGFVNSIILADGTSLGSFLEKNKNLSQVELDKFVAEKLDGILSNSSRFLSTSANEDIAHHFATINNSGLKIVWKLKLPKGTNACAIDLFSNVYPHEAEVLLQRNSSYFINKIENLDGIWYINATIIQ